MVFSKQPNDFGFQKYGDIYQSHKFFYRRQFLGLNGNEWKVPKMLNGKPFYTTHAITDFALNFLAEVKVRQDSDPFFCISPTMHPTIPCMRQKWMLRNTKASMIGMD